MLLGSPAEELVAIVAEERAALLVIGSRGYGPVRRVILGTETGNVLRAATCPVLVVPGGAAPETDDAVVPFGTASAG